MQSLVCHLLRDCASSLTFVASTVFSFPSRYHPLPKGHDLAFKTAFKQPTGLHPVLTLDFSSYPQAPNPSCVLHTYLTLPSTLFVDKYPFSDRLFLKSNNLQALHAISGETDLEAPDWTTPIWGSALLLEIAKPPVPESASRDAAFSVTIPLHLRYIPPGNTSQILMPIPWPAVFYSCPAESGSKFAAAPFDRVNLGYDGLFGVNTLFYPVPPERGARQAETLTVPVLNLEKAGMVEWGTIAAMVVGTIWISIILVRGLRSFGYGSTKKEKTG
jgi:hypothetical protein